MVKIPITKPFFGPEEMAAVQKPLETGWVVQGPHVQEFESKFAHFTNVEHAITTSSCTTALHIAVAALGLKPGDEVIVPAFTWISTANVVEYMGATPIFCDIDLSTFNIDPNKIEPLLSEHTVGIIPVHLFGLCANMAPILDIANAHGLWVVEDAACGFGARIDGNHAGSFGDMGCFSFHPRKSITTGEGGMITTNDADMAKLARTLRDHGASRTDLDRHTSKAGFLLSEYNHLGFNFRMTDIQGALGSVQMDRGQMILDERSRCARHYDQLVADLDWLEAPHVPNGYVHGYQAYVCLFQPETPTLDSVDALHEKRNALMMTLEEIGIATRQGTHAPIILGYYAQKYDLKPEDFPNAFLADRLSLALPLYVQMTEAEQDLVVRELVAALP